MTNNKQEIVDLVEGVFTAANNKIAAKRDDNNPRLSTTTMDAVRMPDIQFFLSRSSYALGTTVVGTVLIRRRRRRRRNEQENDTSNRNDAEVKEEEASITTSDQDDEDDNNDNDVTSSLQPIPPTLKDELESVTVFCAGYCKIDARWHTVDDYIKIYGRTHPHLLQLSDKFDDELLSSDSGGGSDTVCIWATNGLEALHIPERTAGKWPNIPHADDFMAFTFRVNLPNDLPHSLHATPCKYYYVANLLIKCKQQQTQMIWKRPFVVTTDPYSQPPTTVRHSTSPNATLPSLPHSTRVKFGTIVGMAHSNGLPCHLSASELARPHGQMTVKSTNKRAVQKDSQTVRVRNSRGQSVCLLHIMGMNTATPGSCIYLEWDFTRDASDAAADTVPCHQVAACVQGEERAMRENGSSVRTHSILLDTCHEWVEPGVTDTISKTLRIDSSHDNNNNGGSLESSTPYQVQTDIISISIWLQVDMTVDAQNGIDYETLSLQLPLHIRHKLVDEEDLLLEQEEHVIPLTELLGVEDDVTFPVQDIRADLKNLARLMHGHLFENDDDDDDEDSANDNGE